MWKTVKLGELCTKITDGSHNPPKGIEHSCHLMLSSKNVFDDEINYEKPRYLSEDDFAQENKRTDVKEGDVLLTIVGTIGRCAVVGDLTQPFTLQRSVAVLKPKREEVNSRFLMYTLRGMLNELTSGARGVAQKGIYLKSLKQLTIPLPPLAEQQRIVAKLDAAFAEIDRSIELAKGCKENAARFYSHTIDALFNEYANQADNLGELSAINYGYTAKASREEGSYKFLRITDIQENTVDWDHVPFCEVEEKKLEKVLLHDGDIVFARTGATTGKSFLVEKPKDAVFASYLIRVSVDRERLIPRYVMHYFQSASYWEQVEEGISGAAQGGFNATKLAELKIPVVAKKIQQALIAKLDDALESSRALDAIYAKKTQQLSQLKSAILVQELQPPQSEAA